MLMDGDLADDPFEGVSLMEDEELVHLPTLAAPTTSVNTTPRIAHTNLNRPMPVLRSSIVRGDTKR